MTEQLAECGVISMRYFDEEGNWRFSDVTKVDIPVETHQRFFENDYIRKTSLQVKEVELLFANETFAKIFLRGMLTFQEIVTNADEIRDRVADRLIAEHEGNVE